MENLLSLKDFRTQLTKYADRVSKKGDSFVILKRSKPVFKVVPINHEEEWETVIDFTEIDPKGVPFSKVIKALEELESES